jgi:hypothetical protein
MTCCCAEISIPPDARVDGVLVGAVSVGVDGLVVATTLGDVVGVGRATQPTKTSATPRNAMADRRISALRMDGNLP